MSLAIVTGMFYTLIYSIATLIFSKAEASKLRSQKKMLIIFGVLFLTVTATMRNINVGTDTADTISKYFTNLYSRTTSFNSLSTVIQSDIIYIMIAKILHFLRLGERTFLFIMEALCLTPIALCAYYRKDKAPIQVTMAIFLIMFYQISFNWMRQSVSSAFLLLALVLFQDRRIKSSILVALLSILFHTSAVIGISLFAFIYIFMRIKNRIKSKNLRTLFVVIFMVIFLSLVLNWQTFFTLGVAHGIFPQRYLGYIRVFSGQTTVKSWFVIGLRTYGDYIIRLVLTLIPFIYMRKNVKLQDIKLVKYYRMITVASLLIYSYIFFVMHSTYGNRLIYSLDYIQILSLGMCYIPHRQRPDSIPLCNVIIFGTIILYNIWLYYVLGWHGTVPFYFL